MSLGASMKAHGFKLHRLLLVMALTALATGTGHTTAVAAEAGAGKAKPIQCACCTEFGPNIYPRVRCTYFCDTRGRFERVFFEPRSSELTPIARKILRKQAICLNQSKFGATLWGGADFQEAPGRKAAKILAARRAAAVKSYLASIGVPSSAINMTLGWELDGLRFGGRTPEERRFNRYVKTKHSARSR